MTPPCLAALGLVSTAVLLGALAAPMNLDAAVGFVWGDIPGSKLKKLSAAEVAASKVLSQYLKSLEGKSDQVILYKVKGPVGEIESDPLAALFPKWKFYVVPYAMEKNPNHKKPVAIALGLYNVLGINDHGESCESFGLGDYEGVGKFLAANKVPLRNAQEGKLIWVAICHLVRKGWADSESRLAAPDLWHLGVRVSGDYEYYYEVRTGKDGIVLSGTLHSKSAKSKKD